MSLLDPKQPLWLPEGSVRAIVTLGVVGTTLSLLARGQQVPELLAGAFVAVLAFYGIVRTLAQK